MPRLEQEYYEAMNCSGFTNKETETEYSLKVKDNIIYLSFDGSRSRLDWIQNFQFGKVPYKHMEHKFYVHRGMITKYKSVREDITNFVAKYPTHQLKIYGFSQGGGLAILAHEDFFFKGKNPTTFAFAPLRVFSFINKKVIKSRTEHLTVIANVNDIVPKIPFKLFGYITVGEEVKLGKRKLTFPWDWPKEHLGYLPFLREL